MKPNEYELFVAEHFRSQGYRVTRTPTSNDYGIDIIAESDSEKLAIQVKMYGGTTRKVNRQMIMQLHGAAAYADCDKSILVTNGEVLPDAQEVAQDLNIHIHYLPVPHAGYDQTVGSVSEISQTSTTNILTFDDIWQRYIIPLEGRTIPLARGRTNRILKVHWGGIERVTSTGRTGRIEIKVFRFAVDKLLRSGSVTRDEINQFCEKRVSSGVVAVLSQVPFFVLSTTTPTTLHLVRNAESSS